MDQRERIGNLDEALRCALDAKQADLWTAMPGIVQSFDPAKMTCSVQVAVQAMVQDKTGKVTPTSISVLTDCPVQFPGGGGFTATFPIAQNDECLVVFASRCIDAWWQQGGTQPPAEYRMHDLSDGFVVPGVRSQPRVLSGVSTNSAQLRTDDGTAYIELGPAKAAKILAPDGINLNGVIIDSAGNIIGPGTVVATGEGTFNGGHTVSAHTHPDPQGSSTGTPTG